MAILPLLLILSFSQQIPQQTEGEQYEFQADVSRVLDIFINSLYTHKDIFLRQVISNASDALDKIRYLSITDETALEHKKELEIYIDFDKENKLISITDSGVGMTKTDLIKQLGTVAKTGTTQFVQALSQGTDINLIGQFGVGFYSTFLVAQEVIVTSKHNNDNQHVWVSKASSSFKVFQDPRGDTLGRGTRLTIKLKQDSLDFVDQQNLRKVIRKYSEFVQYPIYLRVLNQVSKQVDLTQEQLLNRGIDDTSTTKIVQEKVWEWERINQTKPIWLREEVEDEEYNNFYKSLTRDSRDPMSHIHFTAQGQVEFKALVYIPSSVQGDMFRNYYSQKAPIKLYVKRVLITEEFQELLPRYLSFIRGVVDSDYLPLNVARQNIQHTKILKLINKKLTRKILQELLQLSQIEYEQDEINDYLEFYHMFGKHIKLGVMEDTGNKSKLSKLLRFYSTRSIQEVTSFDDYITRMKDGQDDIFFIAGDDRFKLQESPLIQKLIERGYQIMLLEDPIDQYTMNSLNEYEKYHLQNVGSDDWFLPEQDEDYAMKLEKALKKHYDAMLDWLKGNVLMSKNNVVLSRKLHTDPSIITASGEQGQSANLEKISKAQTFGKDSGQNTPTRKVWELNPSHPITHKLNGYARSIPNEPDVMNIARTLYDIALIQSGFLLPDPVDFYVRVQDLLAEGLGVGPDDVVSEPDIYIEMEEEVIEEL